MNDCFEPGDDLAEIDEAETFVFEVPVRTTDRMTRMVVERRLPIIAVMVDDEVTFPTETFAWARSRLLRIRPEALRREVNVIARLYQCSMRYPGFAFDEPDDVDLLVSNYLYHRLHSPTRIRDRPFPGWKAVAYETAVQEFAVIRSFANFCKRDLPGAMGLGLAFRQGSRVFDFGLPKKEAEFFTHLKVQRDRWQAIVGLDPVFPREMRGVGSSSVRRSGPRERTMLPVQVDMLLDAEENPMWQALWLLLFGLGIRISEALNLWTCDILPGSLSAKIAGFITNGEPFIILAVDCH